MKTCYLEAQAQLDAAMAQSDGHGDEGAVGGGMHSAQAVSLNLAAMKAQLLSLRQRQDVYLTAVPAGTPVM